MALKYLSKVKSRKALIKSDPIGALVAELQDVAEQRVFVQRVQVSFETGEQGTTKIYFPYKARILKVRFFVNKALAATDVGTIDVKDSAGTSIGSQLSIPLSTVFGNEPTAIVPTGTGKSVAAADFIQLITAKTTAGGKVIVSVEYVDDL